MELILHRNSVDYDYDTTDGYEIETDDGCYHKSKINNVRFGYRNNRKILMDIFTDHKVDYCYLNEKFREHTKINLLISDDKSLPTEIFVFIDSVLESMDFYDAIQITASITEGYYGEEIENLVANVNDVMVDYFTSIVEILIEKGLNAAIVEVFPHLNLSSDINVFIDKVDANKLKPQCRIGKAIASKSSGSYSEEYPLGIVLKTPSGYKILSSENRISESVLLDRKSEIKLMIVETKQDLG